MITHKRARFRAIETLQAIRDQAEPGTQRHEEADYAIDLALCPNRRVDDYLVRNTLRDARRILTRRKGRQRLTFVERLFDGGYDLPGRDSPQDRFAAEELALNIESSIASTKLRMVLEDLVEGRTCVETAKSLRVSPAYIKKLRAKVRKAVLQVQERITHGQS